MAGNSDIAANIIDPKWILSEETGKLRYEKVRCVRHTPLQVVLVEHTTETVSREFADRYRRIMEDKLARRHSQWSTR